MPVSELPIFTYFNEQRFTQHGCMSVSNWYGILDEDTKKGQALYPCMGRAHVEYGGLNQLIFTSEASKVFKTINFFYVIVGTSVIQVDKFYNQIIIGSVPLGSTCWFSYLPVNNIIYAMLTTGTNMYVITEFPQGTLPSVTFTLITDPNAPINPLYVATFGNSFVVSTANTPNFGVSAVNLGGFPLNAATAFTENGAPVANIASGVIGQMATLHNQLYIFCDFTTDVWANIVSQQTVNGQPQVFPFKLNSSYNWDYGIADPNSLSVDFGMLAWLGKNSTGLRTFMVSNGQQPTPLSTQAINVLIQNSDQPFGTVSPFVTGPVNGFLYQYENTIFYRASAGPYLGYQQLDIDDTSDSLEYNFSTKKWGRVIELNGERNRINRHIFFNNVHLVTVLEDNAMYQMAGNIYHDELLTPNAPLQAVNTFTKYPKRYLLQTPQIFEPDYSEFITDYVEIDFVFGDKTFYKSNAPYDNTTFIITEDSNPDCPTFVITEDMVNNNIVFVITEDGNTPSFSDNHYNQLFKPYVALYISDDGGVNYETVDLREFSRLGEYRWRMRWYELGTSRNRSYKLECVSSVPIIILGAVQCKRRASGGAN